MSAARRGIHVAFAVIFALLALNAWAQVALRALGRSDDPAALVALQLVSGAAAAATAAGIWRARRWAWVTAVAYGIVTACMIVALEVILPLEREARGGLWVGAATVLLFSLLAAWYLRRSTAPAAEPGSAMIV